MSPAHIHENVSGYVVDPADRIIGHAKVELLDWTDRDGWWLRMTPA